MYHHNLWYITTSCEKYGQGLVQVQKQSLNQDQGQVKVKFTVHVFNNSREYWNKSKVSLLSQGNHELG